MFVFSTACIASSVSCGQDIWKSSRESSNSCLNAVSESTGLYVPSDSSAYSTTRSLSESYENRCASLPHICRSSHEVQANISSTPVCLSRTSSAKQSQMQKLPVALMAATQLNTLTLQSPSKPCARHIVSDTRVSEMRSALPSSTVTVCCHSVDAI